MSNSDPRKKMLLADPNRVARALLAVMDPEEYAPFVEGLTELQDEILEIGMDGRPVLRASELLAAMLDEKERPL